MDTFVDWIEAAGYPITREGDYSRWLERFEAKLRALPEEKRQRSVLPVIASVGAPLGIARSIDSAAFVEAVRQLPLQHVPQLDHALLAKYLSDMRLLGLIPEPGSGEASARVG
jgi:fatty acid CoA ligase FadD9